MMTLEEAIKHCNDVASSHCNECGQEHKQLSEWLKELKCLRKVVDKKYLDGIDYLKQCSSKVTSKVSEGVEEAAQDYTEKGSKCQEELDAFKAGANWQRQQMMAKAVDGHVGQTINGMLRALSDETFGDMGFTAGDKVKLIIIKED